MRIALTSLAIAAGLAVPSDAAELTVTVIGGQPSAGQMLVGVFDGEATFLETAAVSGAAKVDGFGQGALRFKLAPGTYAIAVTYDRNDNGVMDRTALGLPAEPYAFSNDARAVFGPPSFARAAFALPEAGTSITITLGRAD